MDELETLRARVEELEGSLAAERNHRQVIRQAYQEANTGARRLGRSTRALVEACTHICCGGRGAVLIIRFSSDEDYIRRLVENLEGEDRQMVRHFLHELAFVSCADAPNKLRGRQNCGVFVDHRVHDWALENPYEYKALMDRIRAVNAYVGGSGKAVNQPGGR